MKKIEQWLNEITKPKAGILHDMGNGVYEYEIEWEEIRKIERKRKRK